MPHITHHTSHITHITQHTAPMTVLLIDNNKENNKMLTSSFSMAVPAANGNSCDRCFATNLQLTLLRGIGDYEFIKSDYKSINV